MPIKASDVAVGDTFEEVLVEDLKRTQLVMYAGTSGDYNPLHTDDPYCRDAAGYPGVFAHGMLTMGMTGRLVTNFVGAANVRKYGVRFTNQVWPGDDLEASATFTGCEQTDDVCPWAGARQRGYRGSGRAVGDGERRPARSDRRDCVEPNVS